MKQITFKKLLQLSDVKLGMEKQYYVPESDVVNDFKNFNYDWLFSIKKISDVETTKFGKQVYLCEWKLAHIGGWINMEVQEYENLK